MGLSKESLLKGRKRMKEFITKKDWQENFEMMMCPLKPFYVEIPGKLKLGTHGTVYSESTREVEAFLRPLWGFGPYLIGGEDEALLNEYLKGITVGTDPRNEDYWGDVTNYDQLIVEMASLSTCLLLNKEKVWDRLPKEIQINLANWLIKVNDCKIPKNNWYFFRILVNVALMKCGKPYSQEQIDSDFEVIEGFYCENGWYFDGADTQFDYYISFAIHYYSLIYSHFMAEEDPERTKIIKERAIAFAQTFKYWFDTDGEGLPFGRSLTYRFAQVSFFSALVFADVEALPWGEIKGLISRHLKNWMSKEIFSTDGLLTVGYHYENLVMSEGYNGPGSPYWAMKSFLLLAVPDEHPYWQAEVTPLKIEQRMLAVPESKNFYQYNEKLTHLQAFPAGQFVNQQSFPHAKYSKFVYSTKFGFSVPKSDYWYYEGAYDSTLALSKEDHYFRAKGLDRAFSILSDRVIHEWMPWEDVSIRSTIIPLENCHVRVHEVETKEPLTAFDGGFCVPFEQKIPQSQGLRIEVKSEMGTTSIEGIHGYQEAQALRPEPNTNVFFQRTILPYVRTDLKAGKHVLISLVSGILSDETLVRPMIKKQEEQIVIKQNNKTIELTTSFWR